MELKMHSKPIIAVDVDDVLLPHFQDLVVWYNQRHGTHLTLADNGSNDLTIWGAATDEEAIGRVQKFFESSAFLKAKPFREAKAALVRLSAQFELVVVTARDTLIEQVTRDWLQTHFADMFRQAHFTAKYSLDGKRRHKADVLRELGAAYLIDDSIDNILAASQAGVQGILFGVYPWNEAAELPAEIVRCADWAAVLEYFDGQH